MRDDQGRAVGAVRHGYGERPGAARAGQIRPAIGPSGRSLVTLAAGAQIYVIGEMFSVGRKMNTPVAMGWGVVLGFLAGYATDLVLTFAGT